MSSSLVYESLPELPRGQPLSPREQIRRVLHLVQEIASTPLPETDKARHYDVRESAACLALATLAADCARVDAYADGQARSYEDCVEQTQACARILEGVASCRRDLVRHCHATREPLPQNIMPLSLAINENPDKLVQALTFLALDEDIYRKRAGQPPDTSAAGTARVQVFASLSEIVHPRIMAEVAMPALSAALLEAYRHARDVVKNNYGQASYQVGLSKEERQSPAIVQEFEQRKAQQHEQWRHNHALSERMTQVLHIGDKYRARSDNVQAATDGQTISQLKALQEQMRKLSDFQSDVQWGSNAHLQAQNEMAQLRKAQQALEQGRNDLVLGGEQPAWRVPAPPAQTPSESKQGAGLRPR